MNVRRPMRLIPIAEVFHDPQTGYFGYRYFFKGRPPHYTLATFPTLPATLAACDPLGERVWQEASFADENKILISCSYKPGSVLDLLSRTPPHVSRR
jgi:hypothetical protein